MKIAGFQITLSAIFFSFLWSCEQLPKEVQPSLKQITRPLKRPRIITRNITMTLPSFAECHILVDSRSPESLRKEFGNLRIEEIIGDPEFFVPSATQKDFGVMSRIEIKRRLDENQALQYNLWTGAPPEAEIESLTSRDIINDLHKFPKRLWIADYLVRIPRSGYLRVNPEKNLNFVYQVEEDLPASPPDIPVNEEHRKALEQKERIDTCLKSKGLFLYLHYLDSQDLRCVRQADAFAVFTCPKEVLK